MLLIVKTSINVKPNLLHLLRNLNVQPQLDGVEQNDEQRTVVMKYRATGKRKTHPKWN